jgi:photosynthetic reaction center cytochrome c subunit
MMHKTLQLTAALAGALMLSACEWPDMEAEQLGFRGVAMEQVTNPRIVARAASVHEVPEALPPAAAAGPKAGQIYQNVQVLGDLSIGQFTRTMQAMTQWVAPEQGCQYCHVEGEALSADTLYTKRVSRRMLQMTADINNSWNTHVGMTGVTCYTCHRGNNVPANGWFYEEPRRVNASVGPATGQNRAAMTTALASLPYDPFSPYLQSDAEDIRVISDGPLPIRGAQGSSIQDTERTYALMMHMSSGLGVNCTYCHNSRAFSKWDASRPQRTTAWYGIRMLRDVNDDYLVPLTGEFPDHRLGPMGDVQKANCTTCHQGVSKPLNGVSMLADYPELNLASY